MADVTVRDVFLKGMSSFQKKYVPSAIQLHAADAVRNCRTPAMGFNAALCEECSHLRIHYCSCGNRNCPQCQQVEKEKWIDRRRSEVLDAPYFHAVFTLPSQLHSLVYANQTLLYGLLHRASSYTLLTLSRDKQYLGAEPVLHRI